MNERIRELAEQAGWMMGNEVEGFNTRLEKFAELIVNEVFNRISEERFEVYEPVVQSVKQYFGVEE